MKAREWLARLLHKKVLGEYSDLAGWRNYYFDLMLFLSIILLPIAMVATIPAYVAEKHYEIIAYEFGTALFLLLIYFIRKPFPRGVLFFFFFSVMILVFFVSLGPFYARPAWIVLSSVAAALLFGAGAAMAMTGFNAALLTILYLFIGPHLSSWAPAYTAPVSTWIIFVVNISLISLVASLPASLLLTRLNTSFSQELDLRRKLSTESEFLQATNAAFEKEIAERRQVEETLQRREAVLQSLLAATPVGVALLKDRAFIQVNSSLCRITGYSEEEMVGMQTRILYPDADGFLRMGTDLYDQMEREGLGVKESVLQRKDGALIDVMLSLSPFDPEDMSAGVCATVQDITERKRADEVKKRLEMQLSQSQKMEAIGTLAGGIAHDFNNILSAILGYSELAMSDVPEPEKARSEISEVIKAADRAKELVKQILTFSRRTETTYSPLELPVLIKESLKMLRSMIPSTIEIHQDIIKSGLVMSDHTQIHQIMMNLCTNAAHAMDEAGGVLSVSLKKVRMDAAASRDLDLPPGPYLRLTVSDTGYGMTPGVMKRIFEPYFTTKELGRGTGLGLSVIHGIVISHGGAITCESEPGKGATFDIYLPETELGKGEATSCSEKGQPLPMGSERILFADDEPALADMAEKMLSRLGYTVITITSSLKALEVFEARPDTFDLVVTDMTMPGMTGVVLAQKLLEVRPDIPIILCTGYSEHISEEEAKRIGVREFVMKPFEMAVLAERIRAALDQG